MRAGLSKILVTGGAGFIGSAFVRQAIARKQKIAVLDALTYAGDRKRLASVKGQYAFYRVNIVHAKALDELIKKVKPTIIVHFAAETHVDRSILDAKPFIETNITGTQNLIQSALNHKIKRFIHISTDEVYGESKTGRFKEDAPLAARNPYSASKAAGELLINAAIETHHLPAIIIRPSNNYGPWQYPEKFIPVILAKALNNEKIPVYGRGKQIREWLFVEDCAKAIHLIVKKGKVGSIYNIGTQFECTNIATAHSVLRALKKPKTLIKYVKDRPGHDFRYSVNYNKLKQLGWSPKISFKNGLQSTIEWYSNNENWVDAKRKRLKTYLKKLMIFR